MNYRLRTWLSHKHSEIQVWQPPVTCMMSSTTSRNWGQRHEAKTLSHDCHMTFLVLPPVLFDVFPGPHSCSSLHILLQHRSDGIPPPPSQILSRRFVCLLVLEVLPAQSMSVKRVQCGQEALVLHKQGRTETQWSVINQGTSLAQTDVGSPIVLGWYCNLAYIHIVDISIYWVVGGIGVKLVQ